METTKEYRKINELKVWEKNPRVVLEKDFQRLKKQLTRLGQYKPVIITPENLIIGGRSRYEAMKDLGWNQVWVSVVTPKDESEMLEYVLSDNDSIGSYVEEELAELLQSPDIDIPLTDYKIDVGNTMTLETLLKKYGPSDDDKVNKDEEHEELVRCPKCGFEFVPKEEE
jgi:ParB-like nuclease domain